MRATGVLRVAALPLLIPAMATGREFPIGAWFPGMFNSQSSHFARRLDQGGGS